jgi:hypothetical protein
LLRRISGGGWIKLHSEELHNLYPLPNIIRMIESRRMKWAGHVARMGEMRNAFCILVGKPERKNHSDDVGVDGRIILKWMLGKWGLGVWLRFIWLRIGTGGELL